MQLHHNLWVFEVDHSVFKNSHSYGNKAEANRKFLDLAALPFGIINESTIYQQRGNTGASQKASIDWFG